MSQEYRIGVFETVFPRPTLAGSFGALRIAGFASVQFDLAAAGIDPWTEPPNPNDLRRLDDDVQQANVAIPALSGTYNMAHPDVAARATGHDGLVRVIEAAPALNATFVTLCTGSRSRESMWREHRDNMTDSAWQDSRASIEAALPYADLHGVTLLIEPEPANVVGSARLARRMLDEVGHPRLKIVLDPANIVLSDLARKPEDVLSESFDLLGADISFAHAKDLTADGRFCAAGTGIVPWSHYRSLLAGIGYQGDVIFHTLTEADVPHALEVWNR